MVVTEDRPGKYLHVEDVNSRGGGPHQGFFILLVVLVLLLVGPAFVAQFVSTGISLGQRAQALFLALLVVGVAAVPAWFFLKRNLGLRSLTIDEERKVWTVEEWSTFHLLRRQWKVPLTNVIGLHISGVNLTEASLGRPLQLQTQLLLAGGKGFSWRFPVDGVGTREGVLDLAHRIGAAAGLPAYEVTANNPRVLALAMRRPGPEHAAVKHEPIVRPASPAPCVQAKGEPRDVLSKEVVSAFLTEPYEAASPYYVDVWKPGELVQLSQPWRVPDLLICIAGSSLVIGGGVWLVSYLHDHPLEPRGLWWSKYGVFVLATLPIHIARFVAAAPATIVLDWRRRTIDAKRIASRRTIPFDQVTWVETRGIKERRTRSSDPDSIDTSCNYRVETWAHTESDAIELSETTNDHSDLAPLYALALPFGVEIAKALGVPHQYRGV